MPLNPKQWHFDIDRLLNPYIPRPPWNYIPRPISRFLGYRSDKPRDVGTIIPIFWAFIGVFASISVIEVVSEMIPSFKERGAPMVVASFGAGAVLEFYAIESPLAQPRSFLLGQILASVLGVSITKLFLHLDQPDSSPVSFHSLTWLVGSLSCAVAVVVMALTKTIHPPAGATALIAAVDPTIRKLGWFFIAVVALNCAIMLAVALVVNNIQRRFPSYWWTPDDLTRTSEKDVVIGSKKKPSDVESKGVAVGAMGSSSSSDDGKRIDQGPKTKVPPRREISLQPGKVIVPEGVYLMPEEMQLLEEISYRL